VPQIVTNNAKSLFFETAVFSILSISNHHSFRVIKLLPYIFCLKNIFIFYHWKWPAQGTSTVAIVSAHFRSLYRLYDTWVCCLSPFFLIDVGSGEGLGARAPSLSLRGGGLPLNFALGLSHCVAKRQFRS